MISNVYNQYFTSLIFISVVIPFQLLLTKILMEHRQSSTGRLWYAGLKTLVLVKGQSTPDTKLVLFTSTPIQSFFPPPPSFLLLFSIDKFISFLQILPEIFYAYTSKKYILPTLFFTQTVAFATHHSCFCFFFNLKYFGNLSLIST